MQVLYLNSQWTLNAALTFYSEMVAVSIDGFPHIEPNGFIFSETRVDARVSNIQVHNSDIVEVCIRHVS